MNDVKTISDVIGVAIALDVGLRIFDEVNRIYLYTSDYEAYVEQYLIPEQVYQANQYLKRGPMRIIVP